MEQREIKFRAWSRASKTMFQVSSLGYADNGIQVYAKGDEYKGDTDSGDANEGCILMQFTGLHDKNGKEIYEGDVVRWYEGEQAEVVWWEGEACFDTRPILNGFNVIHASDYEVIGNTYENPELLK